MIEKEHRTLHWRATKTNALVAIALLGVILLLSSLFSGLFAQWSFLGGPFAFFWAAQGAFVLMIVLVYWSSARQEKTDRHFGASEEI